MAAVLLAVRLPQPASAGGAVAARAMERRFISFPLFRWAAQQTRSKGAPQWRKCRRAGFCGDSWPDGAANRRFNASTPAKKDILASGVTLLREPALPGERIGDDRVEIVAL